MHLIPSAYLSSASAGAFVAARARSKTIPKPAFLCCPHWQSSAVRERHTMKADILTVTHGSSLAPYSPATSVGASDDDDIHTCMIDDTPCPSARQPRTAAPLPVCRSFSIIRSLRALEVPQLIAGHILLAMRRSSPNYASSPGHAQVDLLFCHRTR